MVIPTLNAGSELDDLLTLLEGQTRRPDEVIVVDSASEDDTVAIAESHDGVRVIRIDRRDFDHGLTRDMALRASAGDVVCFMTQDAVPADGHYVENLIAPILADPRVACSSGRQLPKADARRYEQLVREFNYGPESYVRTRRDIPRLGIKAYFATDVCSAYSRRLYLELGGFEATDMSEDMQMAAKAVNAGYGAAYAADARVYHSHNLTPRQQYARNHAIGRFLERNRDLLACGSEVGEGSRLVTSVSKALLKEGEIPELLAFGVDCAARLLGNRKGRADARKDMNNEKGSEQR